MMNRLQPHLLLQHIMMRQALVIFWSIVIAIHIVLVGMLFFLNDGGDNTMMLGGTGAVYIFSFIAGILALKDTFPLALSMGSTRKHFFVGTQIYFILYAFLQAVLITVLGIFEGIVDSNLQNMTLYHYRLLGASNLLENFVFQFVFILFMIVIANLLASWAYKIGRIFWYAMGGIIIILFTLAIALGWIVPIFQWLASIPSYWHGTLYLLPVIIISMLLSWIPIRHAELKKS